MIRALLLLVALPAVAAGQHNNNPEQLVRRLSDPSWKERERALQRLVRLGRPAVPALRRAVASADPETRWRAQAALDHILPQQYFYEALLLADRGKLREAVARIQPIVAHVPAGTRPDPQWTLGILEEVRLLGPDARPDLGTAIAYHNLECLLREAGVGSGRVREQARAIYRRLLPGNKRAARLLAVLDWEAGDREAAAKHWAQGAPTEAERKQLWTLYDEASYLAVQGKQAEAIERLAQAIARSETARREARVSSDFHMLQGVPAFERLLAARKKK